MCVCLTTQLCPTLWDPMDCSPPILCPWNRPGKNTGVSCHFLLLGIFLTQKSNPRLFCLLHWQAESLSPVPPGKPLPKCTILHSHQQWRRVPVVLHPHQHLFWYCFEFSCSDRCAVVSCFNLQFPSNIRHWESFHVSVCHLCLLFGEASVQVFYSFLNWVLLLFFFFLLLSVKNSLYIPHLFLFTIVY